MSKGKTKPAFRRPRQRFSIIPPGVIWDVREKLLKDTDLFIAGILGTMTGNNGWISDLSQGRVALLANLDRGTVNRSFKRLHARGHLRKVDTGRLDGKLTYQLIFDRGEPDQEDRASHLLDMVGQMVGEGALPESVFNTLREAVAKPGEGAAGEGGCAPSATGSGGVARGAQGGVARSDHRGCAPSRHTEDDSSSDTLPPAPSRQTHPIAEGRTAGGHASPGDGAARSGSPSPEALEQWKARRKRWRGGLTPAQWAAIAPLRLCDDAQLMAPSPWAADAAKRQVGRMLKNAGYGAILHEDGEVVL